MNIYEEKIEANQKQIEKLNAENDLLLRQDNIKAKANSGGILSTEEISLFPPEDRQQLLIQSLKNKNRKYGIK